MKQELHIIPEHSSSPMFVSGDDVALFCRLLFACSPFCYSPLYCISLFDLWLLITTLASSNVLFMYDVMQIYTLLLFTKTKYGINKKCTINQYQGIPNYTCTYSITCKRMRLYNYIVPVICFILTSSCHDYGLV